MYGSNTHGPAQCPESQQGGTIKNRGIINKTSSQYASWWKIHLFRGMVNDLRRRIPYYYSDWTDAWDYRVVPATVYMYFANILPALAFSLDMFQHTRSQYGVNEVLSASVLGAMVFSLFAAQPLVIVGVTGFMAWIGIWSLIFHWILAITNSCNWLRWVTRFPCDIFGFYVAFIYLQKGIQVLDRLSSSSSSNNDDDDNDSSFYLSITVSLLVFMVSYICSRLGTSHLFRHTVRVFLKDYGTPLTIIFFTGFVHWGKMRAVRLEVLPTGRAFEPTAERDWLVPFWKMSVGEAFTALPFAALLTVLFWFDHNVSSLIAQGSEFPLKKPAGFHWDIFLLGLTTGIAGIIGLPFPNGLIPQAPFHTETLCVTKPVEEYNDQQSENKTTAIKADHVVEQRVSNLAQGLLTLCTMTPPLLTVLHLIPHAVLAGLFFIMGFQALSSNGITAKLLLLTRDRSLTSPASDAGLEVLIKRRPAAIWIFVSIGILGFAATFAITQTIAAVGFPVFILALIPVRAWLLPRLLSVEELAVLDGPTASAFIMEGIGGVWGDRTERHEGGDGVSNDGTTNQLLSSGNSMARRRINQPQN